MLKTQKLRLSGWIFGKVCPSQQRVILLGCSVTYFNGFLEKLTLFEDMNIC